MAKIGLPSLKLNNAGVKSKSCGDFRSVAEEALKERKGHDPDIDNEKSKDNIYTGFETAKELIEYSRQHVQELKDKSGRGIRKDAVVMCATVLKPPADFMNKLSKEEQLRFLADAENAFADIVGREHIKATAVHFDELGSHEHVFWEPMTEDGRLCAKEVHNLQFFGRVNRELPQKLREAGWEIEDCKMYDAAKEDYEKERANSGRSSFEFKAEAEAAKAALEKEIVELEDKRVALDQRCDDLVDEHNELVNEHNELLKKVQPYRDMDTRIRSMESLEAPLKGFGSNKHYAVEPEMMDKINDIGKKNIVLEKDNYELKMKNIHLQQEKERLDKRVDALARENRELASINRQQKEVIEDLQEEKAHTEEFLAEHGLLEKFREWMQRVREELRKQLEKVIKRDTGGLSR